MFDERRLYMKQLLRNYKQDAANIPMGFTIKLTHPNGRNEHRLIHHNEGIEMAIRYIDDLERQLEELKYIEKIINIAKEN